MTRKIYRFLFLLVFLLAFPLFSDETAPPLFKGLLLVGKKEDLNPAGYQNIQGVLAYHINLPAKPNKLKKELKHSFNNPLTQEQILAIKQEVISFYQKHHRPVVMITVPEQNISSGVLQLLVTEGKLGQVKVKGQKWSDEEKIRTYIRLEPDQVIASDILDQDLYWMNRNPFRRVDAVYTPGDKVGTTDIELIVSDRYPFRVYAGIDNTGNDVIGNNRLFAGFTWGKLLGTDQTLSYQYSTSDNFNKFQGHALFYEAPLPWRHFLILYGGYSSVDAPFKVPNIRATKFRSHGFSLQGSLRYDIPLQTRGPLLHEFTWGFDFKRTNNNLDLGGRPVIASDLVNLTQLMVGYNIGFENETITTSFEIEGFYSPGQWIADQSNHNYSSLRPFAKNKYLYARCAFTLIGHFYKRWSIHNYLRGQIASINLLPSEEYGIGGMTTVRGYKERVINGDNAFIWNVELRTPLLSPLNALAGHKKFRDSMQFLLFFDYGWEEVKKKAIGQMKSQHLMSIGPGMRYDIVPYLTFRADFGFQLHNIDLGGPFKRLHFSLILGY
ncbi:MAG: ShlB/FhaC/HecB family hemolysin secretion/activation protein [Simkania negevensis]|nr:ShlB/FhaC/HecB family hemolysin secretion/activation protein [Simkania negevensis]